MKARLGLRDATKGLRTALGAPHHLRNRCRGIGFAGARHITSLREFSRHFAKRPTAAVDRIAVELLDERNELRPPFPLKIALAALDLLARETPLAVAGAFEL